ncbi:MAG: TRAP transporter small permease subunit [Spirochaetales bacterium]|jgi:TRAP-type C4-dicarboxylate transport system permease small subunit|nr:TRAP transporter small permease subunit [Spirochaetales bacterium]
MKTFKTILDGIIKVTQVLLICITAGLVLLILNEIVIRNIFNKSFRSMTEVAGLLFIWMAFLGIVVLYDQNRLIALDILYVNIRGTWKTIFWFVHKSVALCLGLIMLVAFAGLLPFVTTEYFSSMPSFSKVWQYVPLAIAGGYMALKSLYSLLERIKPAHNEKNG